MPAEDGTSMLWHSNFGLSTRKPYRGPGKLMVSKGASISTDVQIDVVGTVIINKHVEIQSGVRIFSHRHHWNHSRGRRTRIEIMEPIDLIIEKDAFIGINALIIGIKRIGKGAVIGAGAVITHDVPDFEVWAGNPARKINERQEAE